MWRNVVLGLGAVAIGGAIVVGVQPPGLWLVGGQNTANTRNQAAETRIGVQNASSLSVAWNAASDGDISATPAVDGQAVYFPDWKGFIYAVDKVTGVQLWKKSVTAITGLPAESGGLPGAVVRATPAVTGNLLIMGDQGGRLLQGARVFALDRSTGAVVWVTQIQGGPGESFGDASAIVTTPVMVDDNNPEVAYVGTGGWEEGLAAFIPGYVCCSYRGRVVALSVKTGQILWKTTTVPAGYSGAGVWGATGALDAKRKTLYVTTGNNYSVPASVTACLQAATSPAARQACLAPDDYFDAVLALDTQTGAIKWATRTLTDDTWNVACIFGPNPCPSEAGPDYDFAQGPILLTTQIAGKRRDIVAAGQKSGVFWGLDRDTGAVLWSTLVGPGGTLGGMEWGSASDGTRIYAAVNNTLSVPWTLAGGATTTAGAWSALDPATGQILWQTPTIGPGLPGLGNAVGAVTVANGVVYGCSFSGTWAALNAATGAVLWSQYSGGLCAAGAAVSNGTVYWGTGYNSIIFGPIQPSAMTALRTP